jgi:ubiquinone/menaquinone biosynthesis C-methylase UbiE
MNEHNRTASADTPPPVAMLQMIAGFWVSRALYLAAKLGIADLVQEQSRTATELAAVTGTHAPSLYRVLRALASVGVFAEDEHGRFALTPLATTLRSDVPGSLRAWAIVQLGEEHYQAWGELMHSVRTGEIAFDHVFGTGVWQYRAQHPEHAKHFDEAMANMIGVYNVAVLASYPFSTIEHVVDVGGGDGSLLITLLQANPTMKGVLFDLPHVTERAKQRIADASLTDRCKVVAGDALTSAPSGGDAYILSRVIHDWDDDHAVTILKNCHRAMTDQGKLLLIERVLPARVESSSAAQALVLSDLNMMVMNGGRERTEAEYRALFEAASFRLTKVTPTQSAMSVIEGARA